MRSSLRAAAVAAAVLATVPYLTLKLMWLNGSKVGMTDATASGEMSGTRFLAGNIVTVLLMLLAVAFAFAVTRPWAKRIPASVVLVLGAGATGLLAPILLGLPVGLALQLVLRGEIELGDDTGLAPWVFGVVYGGFGLLAIALAVLVATYSIDRWGHLLAAPPRPPAGWPAVTGALGLLPFGTAMVSWGLLGAGATGPRGLDLPAQRTVLVVTGILSLAAFAVPYLHRHTHGLPRLAWLAVFTGCTVTALQGPTQVLLAHGGEVRPAMLLIALLATPASIVYGLRLLQQVARDAPQQAEHHVPVASR
jgi:hypothetical protein